MKYNIGWSERKTTTTGKEKIEATLKDEKGVETHGVTIWKEFPDFDGIMTGHDIEGDLVPARDPRYGPTLFPPKPEVPKTFQRGAGAMTKVMDKKAENIEKAQDNKMLGIKSSSTLRMAVDLTIASLRNEDIIDNSVIKGTILEWRKWLWNEFEKEDKDFPPFR